MNIAEILQSKPHNKHHLNRYIRFLENLPKQIIENGYEIHHICPKANDLFPEYKNLTTNDWNAIKLTKRQHFIAHLILWKAYGGSQSQAFWFMANNQKITSRLYESIKRERSKEMSKKLTGRIRGPNSPEANENIKRAAKTRRHTYKKHSPEIIEKIKRNHTNSWKGKHHSIESKAKISQPGESNPMFGKKHSAETRKIQKQNRSVFIYMTPWGKFSSVSDLNENPYEVTGVTIYSLCKNNQKKITVLSAKRIGLPFEWGNKTPFELGFTRVEKGSICDTD